MHLRHVCSLAAALWLCSATGLQAQVTFIPQGSTWRYLDTGSDQGTGWRAAAFDDAAWPAGPAQLGYGDGDEATVVSYGANSSAKYITTYFRKAFTVEDPSQVAGLKLELLRDDGAVVYLNGVEVVRSNLPTGTIAYNTLSPVAVSGADETTTFYPFTLSPSLLVAGTNVVAVEIHQQSGTSSDISFDLRLTDGAAVPALARGPYIQSVAPTQATLRWRTSAATDSVVRYGLSPATLDGTAADAAIVTEHAVTLTGLMPNTRYYYSVGSSAAVMAQSAEHFLETHPVTGTAKNTRLWVLGDSGTATADAAAVRNAFYSYNGSAHTDLLLMMGDNAYNSGTDAEYTAAVFNLYPNTLRNTPLWTTLGNHDATSSDSPTQSGPYYAAFTLPTGGTSGGLPSGTEAYYSFDYANMHIISLDSQDTTRTTTGAMYQWLQNDLAATSQEWIIAFFHHPPYTKGTHDSDSLTDSTGRMTDMRANFLPLLESYGVDLVLCGHSHAYERSFLLDGHYGTSDTFNAATMVRDGAGGNPAVSGPYVKQLLPHEGAVYVVAGSSGQAGTGPLNHPAMYVSMSQLGSLVIDVNGKQLNAKFLNGSGVVADQFGIRHEEPPAVPSGLTASAGDSQAVLDWADNSEPDLAGYRVQRSTAADSGFVQVAEVTVSTWTDNTAVNGTTYFYKVSAFDAAGFVSDLSPAVAASPHDLMAPAAPSGITASAGDSSVVLDWADSPEADLAGYSIFRSTAPDSGFSLLASSTASQWTDSQATNGTTWYYAVSATDTAGNVSVLSQVVSATPQDATAPAAPSGLTAAAGDGTVSLDWADNAEGDLAAYRVYRSTAAGSGYALIATVTGSQFMDTGLTNGTACFYVVSAVDAGGNASGFSAGVSATPLDLTPPAAPAGLAAVAGDASAALDWADNGEADFASYRVYRSTVSGSGYTLLASPAASAWTDSTAVNGTTYYYVVRAVDLSGNQSSASAQVSATPAAPLAAVWVQNIGMNLTSSRGKYKATAAVTVRRTGGALVSGATVAGQWKLNGAVISTASGKTSTKGIVSFSSPQVSAAAGSVFSFTVTGITASGLTYNSGLNIETTDSVTVP